jgi:photosystem II stability/assembly factor-like uncharacterized protein
MNVGLYVGTVGMSVWFSEDLGETWKRPYGESGLYMECRVFALETRPAAPGEVLAGTDEGLYRWDPQATKWNHLPSALDERPVWQVVQSPHDPNLLLAGTQPAGLYRSEDGGVTWQRVNVNLAEHCIFVDRTRVTKILFDPGDSRLIWLGIEIDGVYRSTDRGQTWSKCSQGLISEDIHGLAAVRGRDGRRKVFATTNKGLHVSHDDGDTWTMQPLDSPWQYTRTVVERADRSGTIFLTNGDGPPGTTGRLLRSRDCGDTWQDAFQAPFNSTPWCIATHPADPALLFVCTNLGQIYRSQDGGDSWHKLKREFGEVRACVWQPV